MKRLLSLILTILALSAGNANAQNAAKNWLFGRGARIDFTTGTPTTTGGYPINTGEGSSSISDSNGNLLFYTDGTKVWGKNNTQMPNGSGLNGSGSSTHSALIVPCNCNKYFVFTTSARETNYVPGLQYSVVDMNASTNPGFGDVTTLNAPLLGSTSEKIAAISDTGAGYWLVAHTMNSNRFFAYHIVPNSDCKINPQSAVISSVGTTYPMPSGEFGQGQMKISPDGKLLAVAGLTYGPGSFVELFKFDTSTGVVSNVPGLGRDVSNDGFYGVEFSHDSKFLYSSTTVANNSLFSYTVSPTLGMGPRTLVHNYGNAQYTIGGLQLAPNNRIYIARKNQAYVDYLPTPWISGGGWSATAQLPLAGGSLSQLSLPTMVGGDFSCGPKPDVCCDKMTVTPALNPPLNQDYKTFEIFNYKQPSSAICSIDIDMQPLPHTVTWQGGMASWLNSAGTNNVLSNFVFNYKRLPTTGNIAAFSVPQSSAAVKFNLGFDNTQAYNGVTTLTINHCDGTKCVLRYEPWIVNPGPIGPIPWTIDIRELSAEFLNVTLTLEGGRGRPSQPAKAKWLGVRVQEGAGEVFAVDNPDSNSRATKFGLSSSARATDAALFQFDGVIDLNDREQVGKTVTLIIRKKEGARVVPGQLRLTLYDENANSIMSGSVKQ